MTRRQWVDMVRVLLGKLDPVRNFRPKSVDAVLSLVYENTVYNVYKNKPYELDDLASYEYLPVKSDAVQNKLYVELPYVPIQIDKVGSGVLGVFIPDDDSVVFVPMYLNELKHYLRSEVSVLDGDVIYTTVRERIYFANLSSMYIGKTLKVAAIKPFDAYGNDEYVKIPSGQTNVILQAALQNLGYTQSEALLNNNTDTRYGTTRIDKAE